MKKKFICELGPGNSYPGGILTVINDYMNSGYLKQFKLKHIVTASKEHKLRTFLTSFFTLFLLLIKGQVALVHLHMSERGSCVRACYYTILSKIFKIPVIIHSHGGEVIKYYNNLGIIRRTIFEKSMRMADVMIVLTPGWKEFWQAFIPENKMIVLPNFVNTPNVVNKKYYHDQKLNLLFLGYISNKKGVYDLIYSIKELVDDGYDNIVLRIAGNGEIDKCKDLISKLNLTDYISVLGWANKQTKEYLLQVSDVLMLTSHYESFGIVALEALSYKVPVICGNQGFTKEIITNNFDGYVVQTGDINDIANKIKLIKDNVEIFGQNGYEVVKSKYSEDVVMSKLKKVYNCFIKQQIN